MLCALVAIYTLTESVLRTSIVLISMGVRQGSLTSCLLFIIFVDELIKIIKGGCSPDGFLQWLPYIPEYKTTRSIRRGIIAV